MGSDSARAVHTPTYALTAQSGVSVAPRFPENASMSAVDSGVRVTDAWTAAINNAAVAAGNAGTAAMAP